MAHIVIDQIAHIVTIAATMESRKPMPLSLHCTTLPLSLAEQRYLRHLARLVACRAQEPR